MCEVEESLIAKLKQFRFRKETTNAAIVSKYSVRMIHAVCFLNASTLTHV